MRNFFLAVLTSIGLFLSVPQATAQQFDQFFRTFRADTLTTQDKRFLQTALAFEGTYNGLLDGDWGPLSQRAMEGYVRREFGTNAEDWHTASLAFRFFDTYERDGWGMFKPKGFKISMLFPYRAAVFDTPSDKFSNWRHTTSSLAYSTDVHTRKTVQNVHDFVLSQHSSQRELYTLRRTHFAITSAIKNNGAILYAGSNYVNGLWYAAPQCRVEGRPTRQDQRAGS